MPYKKTPEEASLWYKGHYCNYIGKDKLYCGCMKNQTFGDYCGKHKSNYLTNDTDVIIFTRFTKKSTDYNKTHLLNTLVYIYKNTNTYYSIPIVKDIFNNSIFKYKDGEYSYNPDKVSAFLKKQKYNKETLFTHVNMLVNAITNYDKYKQFDDKITVIVDIQSRIRRFLALNEIRYKGPAYLNKSKSCNSEDFFSFTPLNEIEDEFFFSYKDKSGYIWSFDIRSLKKLIDMKQGNPYNREKIPKRAKKRVLKRLEQLNSRKICCSIDKPLAEDLKTYIKHRCVDIVQHVNQFGYYVDENWILSLNILRLKSLYRHLEDIWNFRAQLSPQVKNNICPNGLLFNKSPGQVNSWNNIKDLQKYILDDVYKLVFSGVNESDQKLGAMYFLIGLGKVNPICYQTIPWLQYV